MTKAKATTTTEPKRRDDTKKRTHAELVAAGTAALKRLRDESLRAMGQMTELLNANVEAVESGKFWVKLSFIPAPKGVNGALEELIDVRAELNYEFGEWAAADKAYENAPDGRGLHGEADEDA
jgi:hypothetical protein